MSAPESKRNTEELKARANAHYIKGEYEDAHIAYSDAIEEDPDNPVFWANRAQNSLALKKYLDAEADAKKAVELDPKYCKAWARLATAQQALHHHDKSAQAWKAALSCLPIEPTPADEKLKEQCEAGLKMAEEQKDAPSKDNASGSPALSEEAERNKQLPWDRALAMKDDLLKTGEKTLSSSAWVIMAAYRDFAEGLESVSMVKRIHKDKKGEDEETGWEGKPNALTSLSNGILREPRVFHIPSEDWIEKFNEQVTFESTVTNAWTLSDATTLQQEAPERLRANGWDDVRPALSTTVRAWVLAGFIASGGHKNSQTAMDYYSRALSVLEWGRRIWKDVPREQRGSIFDVTFVRGVKRLFLQAFIEAYNEDSGPNSEFDLDDLAEMARDLLSETTSMLPEGGENARYDPGFITSFFINPLAESMSIIGFVHIRKALQFKAMGNSEAARDEFGEASTWYAKAGASFPIDDEKHVYFLGITLETLWNFGYKLEALLSICEAIRRDMPMALQIWEFSQMAEARDKVLKSALDFEDEYREKLKKGECNLSDVITLERTDDLFQVVEGSTIVSNPRESTDST